MIRAVIEELAAFVVLGAFVVMLGVWALVLSAPT